MNQTNDIVCDLMKMYFRLKDEDEKDVLIIGQPTTPLFNGVRC